MKKFVLALVLVLGCSLGAWGQEQTIFSCKDDKKGLQVKLYYEPYTHERYLSLIHPTQEDISVLCSIYGKGKISFNVGNEWYESDLIITQMSNSKKGYSLHGIIINTNTNNGVIRIDTWDDKCPFTITRLHEMDYHQVISGVCK